MSAPHIRVVCFDLDDTLWPIEPVIQKAEDVLHHWLIKHYPRVAKRFSPHDMRNMRRQLVQKNPELSVDSTALRKLNLAYAASAVGYDNSLVEPAFSVFLEERHKVTLYHDVLPVLHRLKEQYILCVLTNGNADISRLIELKDLFSVSIASSQVGKSKPHPAIFEALSQRVGVQPAEIVHVGDDVITDVAGAVGAGIWAVWMNRCREKGIDTQTKPHAIVGNCFELEALLTSWKRNATKTAILQGIE